MQGIIELINYLIASFLLAATGDGEAGPSGGWFPVEHQVKATPEAADPDTSIWVVFAKNIGAEKISVRFPEEPVYGYVAGKQLEISAQKEGEDFRLLVKEQDGGDSFESRLEEILALPGVAVAEIDPEGQNFVYQVNGKWFREHFYHSFEHTYRFQTENGTGKAKNHEHFISSFEFRENR